LVGNEQIPRALARGLKAQCSDICSVHCVARRIVGTCLLGTVTEQTGGCRQAFGTARLGSKVRRAFVRCGGIPRVDGRSTDRRRPDVNISSALLNIIGTNLHGSEIFESLPLRLWSIILSSTTSVSKQPSRPDLTPSAFFVQRAVATELTRPPWR